MTRRTSARLGLPALLPALLLVVAAALAACGSGGSGSSTADPSATPSWPAFDPCDGLDPAPVSSALGHGLKVDRGTKASARCALLPLEKGGPTYSLNYLWFTGGLDAAFDTMKIPAGTVSRPTVPGADAARLIVQQTPKAYAVTGFVQNGNLIQSVNGLALKPYDAGRTRRATLVLLAQMSANAPATASQTPTR